MGVFLAREGVLSFNVAIRGLVVWLSILRSSGEGTASPASFQALAVETSIEEDRYETMEDMLPRINLIVLPLLRLLTSPQLGAA